MGKLGLKEEIGASEMLTGYCESGASVGTAREGEIELGDTEGLRAVGMKEGKFAAGSDEGAVGPTDGKLEGHSVRGAPVGAELCVAVGECDG